MSDLTFKLVMEGENSSLISTVKQSENTTKAVFDAIKEEANKLRQTSQETAQEVGKVIPDDLSQKADSAKQAVGEVAHSTDELGQTSNTASNAVTQFGQNLSSIADGSSRASSSLNDVSNELKETSSSAQKTQQSIEQVDSKLDNLSNSSAQASTQISHVIPEGTNELAKNLTETLNAASKQIEESGENAKETAKNFTDFGKVSSKALDQLKLDLETAKQKLQQFSQTKASPAEIEIAKQQVNQLEQEVKQADQAFDGFKHAVSSANTDLKNTTSVSKQAKQAISGLKTSYTALAGALAAIGIGLGAKQILETADSYTNLSARVKIAVGDTGNFEQAMSGVHQVALMTNSNLEATATLFTKVNDVGQKMGLNQQQNLDLVKTINMAIQTGGGSAQASEAAVIQLTQALQSGVLRGDEFNSMAEQAPGLLKALANGLGVTTGELRKMANEGQLTSSTVVQALQSQSKAVSDEYAKFPLTIGKALEKIQTQWQITIGQMDQASGASATVAQWLAALADNMDVVDGLLQDVGNGFVWVGDQLKRIDPATIQAMKVALESAYETVKSFVSTMATGFESTIEVLNLSLSALFDFSSGVDTAQDKTNGFTKALQLINVALGYLQDGFKGIGILINLYTGSIYTMAEAWYKLKAALSIGQEKEQAIADMEAMKTKAQESFNKASDAAMQFKSKGEQAWIDISKTQQEKDAESVASSKAKLDQLLADQKTEVEGKKVSEQEKLNAVKAYAEASMQANNGVLDGMTQADLLTKGFVVTIDAAGKVVVTAMGNSANAIENSTQKLEAIKLATENYKKADEEYLAFQKQAAAERILLEQQIATAKATGDLNALKSAQDSLGLLDQQEAQLSLNRNQRLTELNQANTNSGVNAKNAYSMASEAAQKLGIDIDQSLNKVSTSFKDTGKAMDTLSSQFPALGVNGKQAADILYVAWEKWLEKAKSQAEIDLAKEKFKELEKQGVLSLDQVRLGNLALQQAIQKLPNDLDPVEQAFERLGIKTKEQLRLAAQSAIADFNTIQASGKATAEGLKQAYDRMVQVAYASGDAASIATANSKAAYLGLQVTVDETGKASVSAMNKLEESVHKVRNATDGAKQGFRELGQTAREEALSSTEAWNKAMEAQSGGIHKAESGSRAKMSFNTDDIMQKLKDMGYGEDRAEQIAKEIYSGSQLGNGYRNASMEWLMKNGYDPKSTKVYGNVNYVNEALEKYKQYAKHQTASMGTPSSSNTSNAESNTSTANQTSNTASSNQSSSSAQSSTVSNQTITFVFKYENKTAQLTGTQQAGKTLEDILTELELIKKSS